MPPCCVQKLEWTSVIIGQIGATAAGGGRSMHDARLDKGVYMPGTGLGRPRLAAVHARPHDSSAGHRWPLRFETLQHTSVSHGNGVAITWYLRAHAVSFFVLTETVAYT